MEYGIQRRNIFLAPPTNDDLSWLFVQFEREEIWGAFGFDRSARMAMLRSFRSGDTVTGIFHRVSPRRRIGFVIMFPPDDSRDYWEFSYAIPNPEDRDAFSAFNATDAMAHYMFEHLQVPKLGWRVWEDNTKAIAVIRRLGYKPNGVEKWVEDRRQIFYELDQAGWAERRARLDRGEAEHPSGTGGTFVTLPKPCEPVVPPPPPSAAPSPVVANQPKMAKKKKAAVAAPDGGVTVADPNDAEIQATVQALSRRDIYAPLGYDRSAPILFLRALRRGELELRSIRAGDDDHWIGFAVIVPPTSSSWRRYEIDVALVRIKEQTHERGVEAARAVLQDFFATDLSRTDAILPVSADQPRLVELAEELGLERLRPEDLSPLTFRRAHDTIAFVARREQWT